MPDGEIRIGFRKLVLREWTWGLFGAVLFCLFLLAMAAVSPLSRRFALTKQIEFYQNHPLLYFTFAGIAAIYWFWLFGPNGLNWIKRSLSGQHAAVLNSAGIVSWTDTGTQTIAWNDLASVIVRRPKHYDQQRFNSITFESSKELYRKAFRAKVVLDSSIMDFEPIRIIEFIRLHRPDLIASLP